MTAGAGVGYAIVADFPKSFDMTRTSALSLPLLRAHSLIYFETYLFAHSHIFLLLSPLFHFHYYFLWPVPIGQCSH